MPILVSRFFVFGVDCEVARMSVSWIGVDPSGVKVMHQKVQKEIREGNHVVAHLRALVVFFIGTHQPVSEWGLSWRIVIVRNGFHFPLVCCMRPPNLVVEWRQEFDKNP